MRCLPTVSFFAAAKGLDMVPITRMCWLVLFREVLSHSSSSKLMKQNWYLTGGFNGQRVKTAFLELWNQQNSSLADSQEDPFDLSSKRHAGDRACSKSNFSITPVAKIFCCRNRDLCLLLKAGQNHFCQALYQHEK